MKYAKHCSEHFPCINTVSPHSHSDEERGAQQKSAYDLPTIREGAGTQTWVGCLYSQTMNHSTELTFKLTLGFSLVLLMCFQILFLTLLQPLTETSVRNRDPNFHIVVQMTNSRIGNEDLLVLPSV